MGKQMSPDVCGPLSPKAKLQADRKNATCHTGMKLRLCCALLLAVPFALCLVFLGLFLRQRYSDPVSQLHDCRVALQNQTSQMRAGLGSLEKRVEETRGDLEKARAERDELRAGLEKAKGYWGTCQEQLRMVEKNATSQVKEVVQREMEKNKVAEEEIKQLKQQLSNLQQMKEQQQKEIQQLEDDLMKLKPLERSKGDLLLGPSVLLFPLLLVGFLL